MKKTLLLFILFLFILSTVSADTFNFYGYTKLSNRTALNNTNITIIIYNATDFTKINSFSNTSNETGWFNLSNITIYNNALYKPIVRHFNSSGSLDYIGPSLPEFPVNEIRNATNITFYLKQGATINITANNGTAGSTKVFHYQVKDKKLGYPISMNFNNFTNNTLIYVPADRNYSIMIYPNQSFPVSIEVTTSDLADGYYHKEFNCSEAPKRLIGYVNGSTTFESIKIVSYLLEPGRMVYFGSDAKGMYNFTGTDVYNTSNGFYNISIMGPAEGSNLIIFAIAKNGTDYYGGFKQISVNISSNPPETNISLYKLVGSNSNLSVNGNNGTENISLKEMTFNLLNSTGSRLNHGFAHVEVEVDYDEYNLTNFTFMLDVNQQDNGSFSLPLLNMTGVKRINIYTNDAAPKKTKLTASQLTSSEINIPLNNLMNVADSEGNPLNNIFVDMIKNDASCDIPNYNSSVCSFFNGEKNRSSINPSSIVMSGAPMSFIMRNSNGITVHYVNVDLLASGPPDALFDNSSTNTESSTFAQVWKFGSSGPEIYDYVIIGIPYTAASASTTGFNENKDITLEIPYLYDDNWNVIWNSSTDNISDIQNNESLLDFRDYLNTSYEAYLNGTGVICSASNVNLSSGLCYKDTSNHMLWFKIPHFSGIGPESTGELLKASGESCDDDSECYEGYCVYNKQGYFCRDSDPYCGDGYCDTEEDHDSCSEDCAPVTDSNSPGSYSSIASVNSQTKVWDILAAGKTVIMNITKTEIGLDKIELKIKNNVTNPELKVSKLSTKGDASSEAPGKVFQYLKITPTIIKDEDISSITIRLKVNKSWITSNNIDENKVYLYRWHNDKWNKLSTKLTTKGSNYYTYISETPGFSTFAISGEEKVTVSEPVQNQTQENNNTEINTTLNNNDSVINNTTVSIENKKNIDWKLIISIIILIIVIFGIGLHYYQNIYKH